MRISDWSSDVCSSDLTNAAHIEARLREIDGLLQQQSGLAGQLTEGLSAGLEQLSARFAALENDGGARNQRLGDAISALTQEAERMEHALASGNVAADGLISREEALLLALDSGAREQIGRAHVCTPITNAHIVCRLLLEKTKKTTNRHYNAILN